MVYAALIVIVAIVASFFYSIIKNDQVELSDIVVEVSEDGGYFVNPGSGSVPDSPPTFLEPITPPPID